MHVDFVVQRSGDIGSPRISRSTSQQCKAQPLVHLGRPLTPAAGAADPPRRPRTRLQLVDALADGGLADPGRLCDRPDPAMPHDPGLSSHQQTALTLAQMRNQHR